MPINIVCTGCKKRFAVSEKFAGQEGPCPQCKTIIQIPALDEQVVVHAPEDAMPKDSKGAAVIAPILREETRFSSTAAIFIGLSVIVTFGLAIFVGRWSGDEGVPTLLQGIAALALAPLVVVAGYSFLRNDEFEPYRGQDLWLRAAACGAAYAFLWGIYAWALYVLEIEEIATYQLVFVMPALVAAGAFVAFASLDLDYSTGLLHYGLYLIITILLRIVAGLPAIAGM
jgi:phage FluMu protein Com